ncbi:MAG: amidase family protein, partial [Fidelibacterota bacterium]
TTEELGLLLQVIAGHDPRDSTSADVPVPDYVEKLHGPLPRRIGVPWDSLSEGVDEEILEALRRCVSCLKEAGCDVSSVTLPHSRYAIATYYVLTMAEASSNLARFDGVRYGLREKENSLQGMYRETRSGGFGEEVKRRIMLGTYVLSSGYYDAYYRKAQKVRRLIRDDFVSAFQDFDILLLPTTPTPAFQLGERLSDPIEMYLSDIFTAPISLAGVPALNIPAGRHSSGLPMGLQLVGDFFAEETILRLSHYIEQNCSL